MLKKFLLLSLVLLCALTGCTATEDPVVVISLDPPPTPTAPATSVPTPTATFALPEPTPTLKPHAVRAIEVAIDAVTNYFNSLWGWQDTEATYEQYIASENLAAYLRQKREYAEEPLPAPDQHRVHKYSFMEMSGSGGGPQEEARFVIHMVVWGGRAGGGGLSTFGVYLLLYQVGDEMMIGDWLVPSKDRVDLALRPDERHQLGEPRWEDDAYAEEMMQKMEELYDDGKGDDYFYTPYSGA